MIQFATKFTPQLLLLLFLLITFLLSSLDKLFNWNDNIAFFNDHFNKTFLRGKSKLMLGFLAFIEIIVSVLAIVGMVQIVLSGNLYMGFLATVIAAKTLLFMLLGQRLAKDYEGAMTITVYFGVTLYGLSLFMV